MGKRASRQNYRQIWKKFVLFLVRLYFIPEKVGRSVLNIKLNHAQRNAIHRVLNTFELSDHHESGEEGDYLGDQSLLEDGPQTEWQQPNRPNTVDCMARQEGDTAEDSDGGACSDENSTARHDVPSGDNGESEEEDESDNEDDDEDTEEDDEYKNEENEQNDHNIAGWRQPKLSLVSKNPLAASALQFSIFFATERFMNGRPTSSLLVYFSGILGFSPDGTTYRRARDFTSSLSALIHQLRLLFLEWALPYRPYPSLNKPARLTGEYLTALKTVRRRYTCLGCLTPLLEFVSLRAYGRKIPPLDGPVFRVLWTDDGNTISYPLPGRFVAKSLGTPRTIQPPLLFL